VLLRKYRVLILVANIAVTDHEGRLWAVGVAMGVGFGSFPGQKLGRVT
jgi:hypothetical protein